MFQNFLVCWTLGASCCFVAESIAKTLNVDIDASQINNIVDFGGEEKSTKGCIELSVGIFGKEFNLKFHILDD